MRVHAQKIGEASGQTTAHYQARVTHVGDITIQRIGDLNNIVGAENDNDVALITAVRLNEF